MSTSGAWCGTIAFIAASMQRTGRCEAAEAQ